MERQLVRDGTASRRGAGRITARGGRRARIIMITVSAILLAGLLAVVLAWSAEAERATTTPGSPTVTRPAEIAARTPVLVPDYASSEALATELESIKNVDCRWVPHGDSGDQLLSHNCLLVVDAGDHEGDGWSLIRQLADQGATGHWVTDESWAVVCILAEDCDRIQQRIGGDSGGF